MAQSSKSTYFNQDELQDHKAAYEKGGLGNAASLIQQKLNILCNTELNIAVMGDSGAGKSTFLNAMRGVQGDDDRAAESGPTETTMKPTSYPHPHLPNVCFWNLPGIGTTNSPTKMYLSGMTFQIYDFFVIILHGRFRENDISIANEIKKLGKNLYFAHSKIDSDLYSMRKRNRNFNEGEELKTIRRDCASKLEEAGSSALTVFLISSFEMNGFDFPNLRETLANNLDDLKKHIFMMSLPNTTLEIIHNKRKGLKKQIWMLATVSGSVGAVPVSGLSFACDTGILVCAIKEFRKYLGLDNASLQRPANRTGKPVKDLKAVVKSPLLGEISKDFVLQKLKGSVFGGISAAKPVFDFIPVIGPIFGAGSSFLQTRKMLNNVLNDLTENAQRVVKAVFGTD
ncbi:interferon-inducible GTPase 5-like [Chiloscyllium plagiosum]|uniref:interferon-inducible GTPase 5-like n=1 Tax=Chiloscyllium plagiosum TaxID=36176 RepID=UPI001CB8574D|nr:interferon-inducible GTPase 5-like [Chiloscyllium plagiosum]